MPRTHAYSLIGQRCFDSHDWHAKGRINVIGAIVGFTFLTVALFEGSVNADVFCGWVTQQLLPILPADAVIVMDNASFHKRADILQSIGKANCTLEFLPAHTPDLYPSEKKWAQAKAIRRRFRCDVDTLFSDHILYDNL